ncbi:Phosphatidylserine/phosphatidylglycerophosphate/ cardiolipin synthase [Halorhabdus sp. SVX81]|uniref:phospholipase D-like domain-containing protein n=1 Tax=Halorhabdus sp. SVX81 TaxID=2978283 RepID=UPI0023DB5705|nr:phospholipase D-like domain-containing protein [Halorhabdus sp. SVX81]WEL17050.1 Phosphatidylserine/phosphatidylglycerophosphate/ cardiolipin synthase [Halorhabdus sp. SVX81]
MRRAFACLVVGLVVGVFGAGIAVAGPGPNATEQTPANASIEAIYPNPVADGDAGEYVVLSVARETNVTGWSLADDHSTARLPNATVSGRFALSTDPARARNYTDVPVYTLDGHVPLANSGENLTLRDGQRTVASVSYEDTPEGELGRVENGTIVWEPLGVTNFAVRRGDGGQVRTFVLPDAGGLPSDVLASADDRILLAAYTFTSRDASETLIAASERGVDVRVLVEGGPVGGMSRRQARFLDRLAAGGVEVKAVGGDAARVDHHHAKYAVVDERAMVLTENWKPAGTGGRSSRGWGVVLSDSSLVDGLVDTFRADARWRDAIPWREFREGREFSEPTPSDGSFARRYAPRRHDARGVALLVAPDNAEAAVIERLDAAETSIDVVQAGVGGANQSFVRALKRAADRGVEVRLLLSRAWYAVEENQAVADRLERWAKKADASLSVRLARPRDRFGKIHAKGVVIDGETVLVGSLNWNDHSARENREVVVALAGQGPAGYFGRVFADDWQAAVWRLSVGLSVVVAVAALGAVLIGRRIEFADATGTTGEDRLLAEDFGELPDREF